MNITKNTRRFRAFAALGRFLVCAAWLTWRWTCFAGGEEVVLVYNSALPESKAVAEYYAQRRHVPNAQVLGFAMTTNVSMTREEYRTALQRPLAKALREEKLWEVSHTAQDNSKDFDESSPWQVVQSKIRYAVLCYGVPFRILKDPDLKEPGTETWKPEFQRNEAAVDSELALLPRLNQNVILAGPLHSSFYMATNAAEMHPTNGLLMVTRLDGPSADIARGLVDKALEAEKNGLWGRAYFDTRSIQDSAYKRGDSSIERAAEICRRLGYETVVDTNSATFGAAFPMSQIGVYVGWYDETVSGPFTQPNVEFLPGAFAYHLHSFSAASLRSSNRNWVGPLLAKGATASMGAVDEPYLGGTPDMSVFIGRFLYEGFTFGEAAYAAQTVLSWQITSVGDPLYCPSGRNLEALHRELTENKSPWLEWSFLRLIDMNVANGRPLTAAATLLEGLDLRRSSAVLTEKLGQVYDDLGKPSSAIQMYTEALKLSPSPLQQVRLRLTLGELLTAAGQEEEAYQNYRRLLEETPNYPDSTAIQRRLLALARKLEKTEDANQLESQLDSAK